ncbi:hypothetical protein EOD39_10515 [Acipenser ruthenus]|uniref:Uncharacterized protein n=1 Tax=Acipenser ruthenus TaxID=7906 RepID=A0A444TXG3_ACIRT|nr:hypothetical protein EOD39_10515 [Acipenser ruthenus]
MEDVMWEEGSSASWVEKRTALRMARTSSTEAQGSLTSFQNAQGPNWNKKVAYTHLPLQYSTSSSIRGQSAADLSAEELASYEELATALECRFRRVEPAVGLRQCLATRFRRPGEKLAWM